jgi:two-component system response regulator ChvI
MDMQSRQTAMEAATEAWPAAEELPVRIVAVDDDESYRDLLSNELAERGFSTTVFPDGRSLLTSLDVATAADIIVLDWSLPPPSGPDLLLHLKRLGINIPVVFLTGRPLIANETFALARGALDFVDKSRGLEVLVHRLRLVAHAKQPDLQRRTVKNLECGKLILQPHVSRALWAGVDLDLTLGEFKIVHLLACNRGQHVTYREIYDCLHYRGFIAGSGENGYRTNVRSAIKRIRGKFRECDPAFAEIENFTAVGYVWGRGCGTSMAA